MIKKIFYICVAILILLISFFIIRKYLIEKKLKDEINEIYNLIYMEEYDYEKIYTKINSIISNDDYAIVEECAKDYLSDLFKQILEISNIINDDKISDVLTISNFNDDGPDFKNTKDYLKTTKQKILNLEADILFYLEEKTIMAYIIDENLEDSYVNLYKSLKFAKNKEVLEKKEYIENLVDQLVNKIEQEEKVIEFLIENKNNWNISDNTINFNSSQLSDEYNKMIAEINK